MRIRSWCLFVLVLLPTLASAQEQLPSITPFPLEIKRTPKNFPEKARKELARELRRTLSSVAQVPDSASLESALAQLKRQDCGRDDDCLRQLAGFGQTLYALYASVDLSVDEAKVIATGRVVRDDRVLVAEAVIDVPRGARSFEDASKQLIARLVDRLVVAQKLPVSRPPLAPTPDPVATVEPKPYVEPLPPPLPPLLVIEDKGASARLTGKSLVIAGGGVLVVGVVFGSVGLGIAGSLAPTSNGSIPRDSTGKANTAAALRTTGVIAMGAGAALAIVGGVLWGTASKAPAVQVFVSPQSSGVSVGLSGGF